MKPSINPLAQVEVEPSSMAGLVSPGFFTSLCVPKSLVKEPHRMKQRPNALILLKTASRTAQKQFAYCISRRDLPMSCKTHNHSLTPSLPLPEALFFPPSFLYCANMVIAGFWVGPDTDDGWGFVEAYIDQIT